MRGMRCNRGLPLTRRHFLICKHTCFEPVRLLQAILPSVSALVGSIQSQSVDLREGETQSIAPHARACQQAPSWVVPKDRGYNSVSSSTRNAIGGEMYRQIVS